MAVVYMWPIIQVEILTLSWAVTIQAMLAWWNGLPCWCVGGLLVYTNDSMGLSSAALYLTAHCGCLFSVPLLPAVFKTDYLTDQVAPNMFLCIIWPLDRTLHHYHQMREHLLDDAVHSIHLNLWQGALKLFWSLVVEQLHAEALMFAHVCNSPRGCLGSSRPPMRTLNVLTDCMSVLEYIKAWRHCCVFPVICHSYPTWVSKAASEPLLPPERLFHPPADSVLWTLRVLMSLWRHGQKIVPFSLCWGALTSQTFLCHDVHVMLRTV